MYHDIAPHDRRETVGFPGPLAARYKLEPAAFEAHLDALDATGLAVGTLDGGGATPAVAVTFDDGGASALLAAEALERRGWRGQFFITSGRIDTPGFLSAQGVRELAGRGHVIGSHSETHPTYMGRLTRSELDREWTRSRAAIGRSSAPRRARRRCRAATSRVSSRRRRLLLAMSCCSPPSPARGCPTRGSWFAGATQSGRTRRPASRRHTP